MTIKSSKELVNDALKEIKTISHAEASKLHKDGKIEKADGEGKMQNLFKIWVLKMYPMLMAALVLLKMVTLKLVRKFFYSVI